jgi:hypothetical protein
MSTGDVGFWDGIVRGLAGKGHLRLIVQPLVAIAIGMRLGIVDAHSGKPPIVMRIFRSAHRRIEVLKEALSDVLLPFCVSVVMDGVLQHYTAGHVRPLAALVVGALLVWLPYSIARGFTNRFVTRFGHGEHDEHGVHA